MINLAERSVQRLLTKCVALLCDDLTPLSSPEQIRSVLSQLGLSYVRHADGPLYQSLVISDAVAHQVHGSGVVIEKHVLAYLHLHNRRVWVMEVTGECAGDGIRKKLDAVAMVLSQEQSTQEEYAGTESRVLAALASTGTTAIRLCRHVPVTPTDEVLGALVHRFLVVLMHCAARSTSHARVGAVTRTIKKYVGMHLSLHRLTRPYRDGLDRDVMDALEAMAHMSQHAKLEAANLCSYNYLVADDAAQSRRRLNAMRSYPWLRYALAGAGTRPGTWSTVLQSRSNRQAEVTLQAEPGNPPCSAVDATLHDTSIGGPTATDDDTARAALMRAQVHDQSMKAIRQAIDQAMPIAPLIARAAGVALETVVWASKWKARSHDAFVHEDGMYFLQILSWLPVARRPCNMAAWNLLAQRLLVLAELGGPFFLPADVLFSKSRPADCLMRIRETPAGNALLRRWMREVADVNWQSPLLQQRACNVVDRHNRGVSVFMTTVANAFDRLGWPVSDEVGSNVSISPSVSSGPTLRQRWLEKQSLAGLVEMAEAWEQRMLSVKKSYAVQPSSRCISWPSILDCPMALGGVDVFPLDCVMALDEETRATGDYLMPHVDDVHIGNAMLFSLRTSDGSRLATIELRLHTDPLRLACHKVGGDVYAPDGDALHQAAGRLVAELSKPEYHPVVRQRLFFQQSQWRDIIEKSTSTALSMPEIRVIEESTAWHVALGNAVTSEPAS